MKKLKEEHIDLAVDLILESEALSGINDATFLRQHDDTDGEPGQILSVVFGPDGDAWVMTTPSNQGGPLRFRTWCGGGRSLRVHKALRLLAEAIRRDNAKDPEKGKELTMTPTMPKLIWNWALESS